MRPTRLAAAAVALIAAGALAALAHDLDSWRASLASGDAQLRAAPAGAHWAASPWLAGDPARDLLSVGDDLALRRAVRAFAVAASTGRGFDNGETRSRIRSSAEVALSDVSARGSAAQASQASTLLGVLVASAGRVVGGVSADDRARSEFEAAVRADPSNVTAKYDLELLLRRTRATATRQGPGTGSGSRGSGKRGAGSGTPGRGY
jgi:hypothetical protein